jgi:chromosomal replication initiation ATPase DnaA
MINTKSNALSDSDHGLIGFGNIKYTYIYGEGEKSLELYSEAFDKSIHYTGVEAENIYKRFINDGNSSIINHIKRIAAESCRISMFKLHEDTREEEVVFARYLIYYYLNTLEGFTLQACGDIFGNSHATVLRAVDSITNPPEGMDEKKQPYWRKRFFQLLKDKGLT